MELSEAVELVSAEAEASAATELEIVGVEGELLETGVRLGEIEKLKRARERRLAVRLFAGSSSAVCSTADFRETSLRDLVGECLALARATAPDPFSGLPDPAGPPPDVSRLELYDLRAGTVTADEGIEIARAAERAALHYDSRIQNSEGAEFSVATHRLLYRTSRGSDGEYSTSTFALSVVPVAAQGGKMQQDYWYTSARRREDLEDPASVGATAAARALRRLGARPIRTCEVPVVFDPEMAASLLGHLAAAVSGSSIYRGTSFLGERLGQKVADSAICIIDDPLRPRLLGSRPFDAEGIPARRNVVIENGVLSSFLLDTYSARKLGMATTASAVRSFGDVPAAGPSNFYLVPGSASPEDIIASVDRGLYVTELSGFGFNPVTGDYSRGAGGLWIEGGRLTFPVEEVTVAGNLVEMLQSVEAVGNDLRFRSKIASPTLKIARMTVAGEG